MELDDKAVAKHTLIPPALLEEIHAGNEEALTGVVRAQMAFLLENALHRAAQPDAPANLITSLLEIQRKIAMPQRAEGGGGQAFNLTLNLGGENRSVTIDAQPLAALEDG